MKYTPIGERVIVRPDKQSVVTKSGLYLVHLNEDVPYSGTILAVAERVNEDIRVGDHVIYAKFAGEFKKLNGEAVIIQHQADIWAVIERSCCD